MPWTEDEQRHARIASAVIFTVVVIVGFVSVRSWWTERAEKAAEARRQAEQAKQQEAERQRIEAAKVWTCSDCRLPIMKSEGEHATSDPRNSLCRTCWDKREPERRAAEAKRLKEQQEQAKMLAEQEAKRQAEQQRIAAERDAARSGSAASERRCQDCGARLGLFEEKFCAKCVKQVLDMKEAIDRARFLERQGRE